MVNIKFILPVGRACTVYSMFYFHYIKQCKITVYWETKLSGSMVTLNSVIQRINIQKVWYCTSIIVV